MLRRGFDAIVVLHSIFSNRCLLQGWLFDAVKASPQPKACFLGNEYKLMPDKMKFCDTLGVSLLVSQSNSPGVHALYRERLGCAILGLPNGGLDQSVFYPTTPFAERPIDIGYRAFESPMYLGHDDKRLLAEGVAERASDRGLKVDISLDPSDRFSEDGWAGFLNMCKAQIGTEAGGNYFELTDQTRTRVNEYALVRPDVKGDEVFREFFEKYPDPISGRMLASRHIEAAGTKTLQILLEGHYNGYLKPDVHYIPLKRDFSNFDEVVAKLRDEELSTRIIDNAYQMAVQELTYETLTDRFHAALTDVM